VNSPEDRSQLAYLSNQLGMHSFGQDRIGGNGLLSLMPLKGVQEYRLGRGGFCQRADVDIFGQRLYLYNLRLDSGFYRYRQQVRALFGPELLGRHSAQCPQLVIGDFADPLAAALLFNLPRVMRRTPTPFWSATYPARLPLFNRDRGYLRGGLRILDCSVLHSSLAREASTHLPVSFTVQLADPRQYLRLNQLKSHRMEIAPG
jgi:endonuclease/exonuclease/phosphatase family metal-dependent hydrolase